VRIEVTAPERERRTRVEPGDLVATLRELRRQGARFVTLLAAESPRRELVAVVARRGELVVVHAPASPGHDRITVPSIAEWWPAAAWAEQELNEARAAAAGSPPAATSLTRPDAAVLHRRVAGLDAFALPYGPIRSGVFEAIQFVIETGGEDVLRLQTRPFFKRRGLERRFAGMTPQVGVHVAERVAGIASVAYATAFCQAVERAAEVVPPPRAMRWRAVYAELERMANHLDVIAKLAETAALSVGRARFQILKEDVLRLQAELTGHRFARGMVVPGGVRAEGPGAPGRLIAWLDDFERRLRPDRRAFLGTASMTDRLIRAGHIERRLAEDMGAVGPLARGSGISTDARHERPYGAYRHLGLAVATERGGDAMARTSVRFREIDTSMRILRQAADQLGRRNGSLLAPVPPADGVALGWSEAPQGELVIRVALERGVIQEVHIASPSLRNWALFDHAFPADVLTDFAFIEHSFGLTPAGAAR
jgi:Ni,Fe-hydrogenase III large subunit